MGLGGSPAKNAIPVPTVRIGLFLAACQGRTALVVHALIDACMSGVPGVTRVKILQRKAGESQRAEGQRV